MALASLLAKGAWAAWIQRTDHGLDWHRDTQDPNCVLGIGFKDSFTTVISGADGEKKKRTTEEPELAKPCLHTVAQMSFLCGVLAILRGSNYVYQSAAGDA